MQISVTLLSTADGAAVGVRGYEKQERGLIAPLFNNIPRKKQCNQLRVTAVTGDSKKLESAGCRHGLLSPE